MDAVVELFKRNASTPRRERAYLVEHDLVERRRRQLARQGEAEWGGAARDGTFAST